MRALSSGALSHACGQAVLTSSCKRAPSSSPIKLSPPPARPHTPSWAALASSCKRALSSSALSRARGRVTLAGLCKGKRFNDTFVLDVDKMECAR